MGSLTKGNNLALPRTHQIPFTKKLGGVSCCHLKGDLWCSLLNPPGLWRVGEDFFQLRIPCDIFIPQLRDGFRICTFKLSKTILLTCHQLFKHRLKFGVNSCFLIVDFGVQRLKFVLNRDKCGRGSFLRTGDLCSKVGDTFLELFKLRRDDSRGLRRQHMSSLNIRWKLGHRSVDFLGSGGNYIRIVTLFLFKNKDDLILQGKGSRRWGDRTCDTPSSNPGGPKNFGGPI